MNKAKLGELNRLIDLSASWEKINVKFVSVKAEEANSVKNAKANDFFQKLSKKCKFFSLRTEVIGKILFDHTGKQFQKQNQI